MYKEKTKLLQSYDAEKYNLHLLDSSDQHKQGWSTKNEGM